ncbi:MAG: ABC transporter substrate-binding protein [Planctomycetaceae bacterium]
MWSMQRSLGNKLTLAAVAISSLSLFSGCPSGASNGGDNTIVIGHYASLSGSEATFGRSTDNGIQLAVEETNDAGGIDGKQIRLITYDDKGESNAAGAAVTRLVTSDNVTAVLGEVQSGLSLAGAPVCQEYKVPMISPSSTNPRVTKVGDMIFRVCFIDSFQGYVCAKFARESAPVKADKIAVLYNQADPYSTGLAEEFKKAFESMGGQVTIQEAYTGGDQDFDPQLRKIRGTNPGMIFIPGYYTDVANIAIQARRLDINVPLLGGDGWDSARLAEIAKENIDGSFYSNHYAQQDPDPRVQNFIAKYDAKYNAKPDGLAALGYDAAMLLFDAMRRSESLSGPHLAKALAATRDFAGVTGTISIDAERNAVKPAVMLQMVKGVPTYLTTIEPPK